MLMELYMALLSGKIKTDNAENKRVIYESCVYIGICANVLDSLEVTCRRKIVSMMTDEDTRHAVLKDVHHNWRKLAFTGFNEQECHSFCQQFTRDGKIRVRIHDEVPYTLFATYEDQVAHTCPRCDTTFFSVVMCRRCEQSHVAGQRKKVWAPNRMLDETYMATLGEWVDTMTREQRQKFVTTVCEATDKAFPYIDPDDDDVVEFMGDVESSMSFDELYARAEVWLGHTLLYEGCKTLKKEKGLEEAIDRGDLGSRRDFWTLIYHEIMVCLIDMHKEHLFQERVYEEDMERCRISKESKLLPRQQYLDLVEHVVFSDQSKLVDWTLC